MTNRKSHTRIQPVSLHVRNIIASRAQALYALRTLRTHGLCDNVLQTIYRSVVVAKLIYASSAWVGFATVAGVLLFYFIFRPAR